MNFQFIIIVEQILTLASSGPTPNTNENSKIRKIMVENAGQKFLNFNAFQNVKNFIIQPTSLQELN